MSNGPANIKVIAKPKCDSKVCIRTVVTAQSPAADPNQRKRTWKVKNHSGAVCPS
jgi:hypothetical protein